MFEVNSAPSDLDPCGVDEIRFSIDLLHIPRLGTGVDGLHDMTVINWWSSHQSLTKIEIGYLYPEASFLIWKALWGSIQELFLGSVRRAAICHAVIAVSAYFANISQTRLSSSRRPAGK
jgi:hypothetical protein